MLSVELKVKVRRDTLIPGYTAKETSLANKK